MQCVRDRNLQHGSDGLRMQCVRDCQYKHSQTTLIQRMQCVSYPTCEVVITQRDVNNTTVQRMHRLFIQQ